MLYGHKETNMARGWPVGRLLLLCAGLFVFGLFFMLQVCSVCQQCGPTFLPLTLNLHPRVQSNSLSDERSRQVQDDRHEAAQLEQQVCDWRAPAPPA